MHPLAKGLVAGFVATVVLSAAMVAKQMMGLMPELDVATMLTSMLGLPDVALGWVMHFMIGTVAWGVAFAVVVPYLPGSLVMRGVLFGIAAWLMMMIAVMPMAGAGLFGLQLGIMAPLATLMLHILYGATLGAVFAAMPDHGVARMAHR
ncbi:MAG: hypothetical protein JNK01_13505 [Devosia sp.]|nr:hypothetical protein [Devosia sp.]